MNRIFELRRQKKLTQKALAEKLNVDQSAVSCWECGRSFPDTQKQIMLADLFGVSIDYMLGRDVSDEPDKKEVSSQSDGDTKKLDVFSSLTASDYLSKTAAPVCQINIPSDWEGEYFGFVVRGNSMSPRYLDGDIVIIRRQIDCKNGQDAFVFVGRREGTLKKIFLSYNSSITLKPINQLHRTMFFTKREIDLLPVVIGGVAVELRRKIQ